MLCRNVQPQIGSKIVGVSHRELIIGPVSRPAEVFKIEVQGHLGLPVVQQLPEGTCRLCKPG
jgi:hypothetical protein